MEQKTALLKMTFPDGCRFEMSGVAIKPSPNLQLWDVALPMGTFSVTCPHGIRSISTPKEAHHAS